MTDAQRRCVRDFSWPQREGKCAETADRRKAVSEGRQQKNCSISEKNVCARAHMPLAFGVYSCTKYVPVCVCVRARVKLVRLFGPASSIKAMFGLINHDIVRSPCDGCSVVSPVQLLFTLPAVARAL